jgi:FMN phosphatase YigB (HAD superfamily)
METGKTLFIFDLDNTLTDSAGLTAAASREAARTMARALNIPLDDLYAAIRKSPDQFRFSDFGRVARWLDEEGHLPPASTPQGRQAREALIRTVDIGWKKARRELTVLYSGVLDALRAIHAGGASIALFTDAEAAPMMQRIHDLAVNAAASDPSLKPEDLTGLFSHFYCQPGLAPDEELLGQCDTGFIRAMKEKTTIWRDRVLKPATGHMQTIMKDHGTAPAQAVMVGDSYKDGACAVPLGVDFVWFAPGTAFSEEDIDSLLAISDPGWCYGTAFIKAQFNGANSPTRIVQASFDEIPGLFRIEPGKPFRNSDCNAPGTDGYCRSCACHADQTRPGLRLKPLFQLQSPLPPLGPASHLPRVRSASAAPGSSDKADREKTKSPASPPPEPRRG